MNTKLKVINFPEAKKRIERRKFLRSLWDRVVALLHRKKGFEKYKVVSWGYYKDTGRVWVTVQNIHSGELKTHSLEMWQPDDDEIASNAIKLFVGKLK